jgi:hypothetical protein
MRRLPWLCCVLLLAIALAGCHHERPKRAASRDAKATPAEPPVTPVELGLPFYPGTMPVLSARRTRSGQVTATVELTTSDSVEQVYNYYRRELGRPLRTDMLTLDSREQRAALGKGDGDDLTDLTIMRRGDKTLVVITRRRPEPEETATDQTAAKGG